MHPNTLSQSQNPAIKKILIIRFSSIGDIILTTPVIRCLKEQIGAQIHFLTKETYRDLLAANPYIDKLFLMGDALTPVLADLHLERYDFIIDLHKNLRTLLIRFSLRRKWLSFDKLNFKKWFLVNFKKNRLPEVHIVDRYLKSVGRLGVKNDGNGLDYFVPKKMGVKLGKLFPFFKTKPKFIAFAIGAAHATKRLPAEKIFRVCQLSPHPIILLGGIGEKEVGEKLAKTVEAKVFNLCGQLSLGQSASVLKQAEVVITHDTGMMHIAAALRKPVVSIWGSTVTDFGMYPYYPEGVNHFEVIENQTLSCRPCSKIGYDRCPKGHFKCMNELEEQSIIAAAERFWSVNG